MHLSAIALCLATAVQLAWSYPQYLFLRSKSSTPAFNNLYLSGYEPPSFIKLNADALTYNLLPAPTTPNGPNLYYLGFNYTSYQAGMRAVLDFDNQEYAYFEPVSFVKAGVGNTAFQNRFFINGTGSNSQLVWKNDPKSDYQVGNWLICTFAYLVPQLYFTVDYTPKKLPDVCGVVDLMIIPVPNST